MTRDEEGRTPAQRQLLAMILSGGDPELSEAYARHLSLFVGREDKAHLLAWLRQFQAYVEQTNRLPALPDV